jgi:hypothetical protein
MTFRFYAAFVGFPGFHLKIITFGAVLGYYIGCYEADAMGQYESLIQRFKEKRGSLAAAGMLICG